MISAQAVPASGARTGRATDSGGFGIGWALLISVAGGLALYSAFPPVGAWPLAVLGPALLVVALTGRSLRGSFGCGLAFGLALFVPLLSWLVNEAWYAWAALAGALAVIFAVLAIGQRLLLRLPFWPAAVAGWWVCVEGVRDRWPYAFPWGRLAMSQSVAPDVRWVAVGGVPLLSFLVALTGAMLARAALTMLPPGRPLAVPPGVGAGAGRGGDGGPGPRGRPAAGRPDRRRADSPGGRDPGQRAPGQEPAATAERQRGHAEPRRRHARSWRRRSRPAGCPRPPWWSGRRTPPTWTRSRTPLSMASSPGWWPPSASPVLVGEVLQDPLRNVGQLWVPGQGPTTMYVKRQLVPFGEYIPFRGLISSFSSLPSLQPTDFTPGHSAVVFDVGKIRLGDVICYEVGFDNLVRSEVTAGANLLAVQSNDADFEIDGQLGETEQQTAMARIRAIESDRAVVYASTTGESTIIAPDGALIAHSGVWQQAILDARVPLVSYRTLADRVGAWPEYVIIMLTVLALAWAVVRSRSRRERRPAGDTLNLVTLRDGSGVCIGEGRIMSVIRSPGKHHVL